MALFGVGVTDCSKIQWRAKYDLSSITVLGMYTDDTSSAVLASRPILKTRRQKNNKLSILFTLVDYTTDQSVLHCHSLANKSKDHQIWTSLVFSKNDTENL